MHIANALSLKANVTVSMEEPVPLCNENGKRRVKYEYLKCVVVSESCTVNFEHEMSFILVLFYMV